MNLDRNEAETRAELIDPAIRAEGWGVVEKSRVRREQHITLGRLQGACSRLFDKHPVHVVLSGCRIFSESLDLCGVQR